MPLTALEVAMRSMVSCVVEYMTDNGTVKITENGLGKMVKEQCKHLEQPEDSQCHGVYKLKMPLSGPLSIGCIPGQTPKAAAMTSDMYVKDNKIMIESRFR